jgi:hypothetical protein
MSSAAGRFCDVRSPLPLPCAWHAGACSVVCQYLPAGWHSCCAAVYGPVWPGDVQLLGLAVDGSMGGYAVFAMCLCHRVTGMSCLQAAPTMGPSPVPACPALSVLYDCIVVTPPAFSPPVRVACAAHAFIAVPQRTQSFDRSCNTDRACALGAERAPALV